MASPVPTSRLEALFNPRSVALIGACDDGVSLGALVAGNLLSGGYSGDVHLVNPAYSSIRGRVVHPSVRDIPEAPDVAIIVSPAKSNPVR